MTSETNPEPKKNRLVLIDTNCLVRIYFSSLRPILGSNASGHEFKTLAQLAKELKNLSGTSKFAWLTSVDIQAEVEAAIVTLNKKQRDTVASDAEGIRTFGDGELRDYCISKNLAYQKSLSSADAKLLAAALELNATLATDEWPLRYVAGYYGYDDGKQVDLLSSVDLLFLLEKEGMISREERVKTYASWLKSGENLWRGSAAQYQKLFDERPPTAQD